MKLTQKYRKTKQNILIHKPYGWLGGYR